MKAKLLVSIFISAFFISSCQKDYSSYYTYNPPQKINDGLEVGNLSVVGMDSSLLANAMGRIYANKYDQIHSFLIWKDNKLIFEEYLEGNKYKWDGEHYYGDRIQWHRDSMHVIMSCTKSVTSAIIGIAIDRGDIGSVHDPIFDYLPDHQQYKTGGRENISIEHLLTMTSGLEFDEWSGAHGTTENDIDRIYIECQEDPVKCVIERDLFHPPGEHFTYSGGNMIILGEILRNATGMDIGTFGKQHFFDPLGIDSVYWYQFENGVFACDGSIRMTPRDMLKIGICFLDNGIWKEQRLISEAWIKHSSVPYKNNHGIKVPIDDTGKNGYAYTWWTNTLKKAGKQIPLFQASGWGGQEIIVIPDLDMVVVFTGGNYVVKKHYYSILERFVLPSIN